MTFLEVVCSCRWALRLQSLHHSTMHCIVLVILNVNPKVSAPATMPNTRLLFHHDILLFLGIVNPNKLFLLYTAFPMLFYHENDPVFNILSYYQFTLRSKINENYVTHVTTNLSCLSEKGNLWS